MKKILAILTMVVFGCGLAGCGEDEKNLLPDEKQHAADKALVKEYENIDAPFADKDKVAKKLKEFEQKHPNIKELVKKCEIDEALLTVYKLSKKNQKKVNLKKWKSKIEIAYGLLELRKTHDEKGEKEYIKHNPDAVNYYKQIEAMYWSGVLSD